MRGLLRSIHVRHTSLLFVAFLLAACGVVGGGKAPNSLEIWHTYAADSAEEAVFEETLAAFESAHPDVTLYIVRVPFSEFGRKFVTSVQGGEPPDIVRVGHTDLMQFGGMTMYGVPVLEDLSWHLRPSDRARFDRSALDAMRMGEALRALPASRDTMALLYNETLFAAHDVELPRDDWTIDDLVAAATAFRGTEVQGLSAPLRRSFWAAPFLTAFGGDLFDADGRPRLNAPGMADAVDYIISLEQDGPRVARSDDINAMKTLFASGRAAMIIDGSWNVPDYSAAGIDLGVAILPVNADTGRRMAPLKGHFGWALLSQCADKETAVELILWLSGPDTQRRFLAETLTLPTAVQVIHDAAQSDDRILRPFVMQLDHSTSLPTRPGAQNIFRVLRSAIQLAGVGQTSTERVMEAANQELESTLTP